MSSLLAVEDRFCQIRSLMGSGILEPDEMLVFGKT